MSRRILAKLADRVRPEASMPPRPGRTDGPVEAPNAHAAPFEGGGVRAVERTGVEPATSALQRRRSPN